MRVIINADDFGLNTRVNFEIERCIHEGLITSTTLMADGEGFADAIRISKRFPYISYGVHLTLDELTSLSKSPVLNQYGLTDENGLFIKGGVFHVKEWTKELKEAVYRELSFQIEKVIASGINPTHFDGHHHCHTITALHEVIIALSKKYGITKVRMPLDVRTIDMIVHHIYPASRCNNTSGNSDTTNAQINHSILSRIMWYVSSYNNALFFKRHFNTTAFCCSVSTFCKNASYMERAFSQKTIELMCHPGNCDYESETNQLVLINRNIRRITYHNI